MENKLGFIKGLAVGMCVTLLCVTGVLYMRTYQEKKALVQTEQTAGSADSQTLDVDLEKVDEKVEEMERIINQYYLNDIDGEKVESTIYKGMMAGLGDDYAAYYTAEEMQKMEESTNGSYVGIGVSLSQNAETGVITAVQIFDNSPAAEVGIRQGDVLYMVAGEEVTGTDLTSVVAKIKTEPGDTVKLSFIREGEEEPLEFDVERREVEKTTVSYEMLEDSIGYIAVSEFDVVTEDQFIQAKKDLESQGMEALIIDLRNNLGGVLDTSCQMLRQILPKGMIVYTEDKYGNREEHTCDGKNEFDKPLAVLVNGYSASASEIFAGAVKDYGIGTLVGTNTFGKGIVQRIFNLDDGTGMKLTTSQYFTPKGNNIHGKGIAPDVEVELTDGLVFSQDLSKEEDNQLQKAIEVVKNK